jgi:ornithine cyclodeaminase/alanine dehydrogenase-like protein (mu-crystallin family)
VAARHLARPDSRVAALVGCGAQGPVQLRALAAVLPLETAIVFDADAAAAECAASDLSRRLGLRVRAVGDPAEATGGADVCVTCTPSRRSLLTARDVRPGTFLAAVGADAPEKRELDATLMASARVVVDSLEQCAAMGELHHALEEGAMTREMVHAELAEIVAGAKAGRTSPGEITIFDSTGVALEDVAAMARVYEAARSTDRGLAWSVSG